MHKGFMLMKVCIVCSTNVEGKKASKVRDDRILKSIRSIKSLLKVAKMNELYVCENDLPKHAERRKKFERNLLIAMILSVLLFILFIYSAFAASRLDLWAAVSAVIISLFILAFPILTYAPAVETLQEIRGEK